MPEDKRMAPIEVIRAMMKNQHLAGDARDYLILSGWSKIQTHSQTFEVGATLPESLAEDDHVWVMERSDSPELIEVVVIEDKGDKLWVKKPDNSVQFLVAKDDARPTPMPLRPTLIHKGVLHRYIGSRPAQGVLDSMFEKRMEERTKADGNGHLGT